MNRFLLLLVPLALACDPVPSTDHDLIAIKEGCLQTGGTVTTQRCCVSFGNYPETCSDTPCDEGCAEEDLFDAEYCECQANACFDGVHCFQT